MANDIISFGTNMTIGNQNADQDDLRSLPLGLLLGRISSAFRKRLLDECDGSGDDVRLIGLTIAIENSPNATQASYARFLGIDLNTISRLINRAEEIGLLSRVPSPDDKRAFVLELSDTGKALAAQGAQAIMQIEASIAESIGQDQFKDFRRTAEHMLRLMI